MHKIITSTLYLMIITIPLIFTTINYELFEFPKFLLLLTATIIIAVAWTIDVYPNRKKITTNLSTLFSPHRLIRLGRTPISKAVLLILITQLLATIFSIDPHTSIWGYYSRFHQGLITTICYTLIYFASLKYLDYKSTQKLIKISISTAILISLYAIAQRLGVDKALWVQDVVNRPFSTLGQPNWLAAYLLPHIFLTLYLYSTQLKKSSSPIICYSLFAILFSALLLTKSRSGLLAFTLSYLTYWALLARNLTFPQIRNSLIHYSLLTILLSALIGTTYTQPLTSYLPSRSDLEGDQTTSPAPSGTQLESGGTESGDIRKIVWTGALDLIKQRPFLGTGPETFAYSYYWTRPVEHNMTSEWDFLYNKAHNEYLNIAATTGLIGLATYLYWHFAILQLSLTQVPKSKKSQKKVENALRTYYPVLAATLISFSVTNFFGFSVIPVYLVMTLLSILPITLQNKPTSQLPKADPPWADPHYYLLFVICSLLFVTLPLRLFLADLNFARGKAHLGAGNLTTARTHLERAVTLRPDEPLYHSYLAELYAQSASSTQSQNDHQLARQEIQYTLDHNPWHLNYAKSRTKAWLSLALLDPTLHQQASQELIRARKLAPTDPKLAYNLGLIYSRLPAQAGLNDPQPAIQQMQDAIRLKPNYYQPYYALTLLYETTKQLNLIPPLLEQAQNHISPLPEPLQNKIDLYSVDATSAK